MNLLEIVAIRDKLKTDLAIVEKFLEIAKAHGVNGRNNSDEVLEGIASQSLQVDVNKQRNLPLRGKDKEYGSIADTVREAIRLAPEKYSIRDISVILEKINKPLTKVQIATVLGRLARRGEIQIGRKGRGSKPTVYKKEDLKPAS